MLHPFRPMAAFVGLCLLGLAGAPTAGAYASARVLVFCDSFSPSELQVDKCGATVKDSERECHPTKGSDLRWCRQKEGIGHGVAVGGVDPCLGRGENCWGVNVLDQSCPHRQIVETPIPGVAVHNPRQCPS